jgi:hypothetical protein
MLPVGFEPTISAGEQPQTHALDRAANIYTYIYIYIISSNYKLHPGTGHEGPETEWMYSAALSLTLIILMWRIG